MNFRSVVTNLISPTPQVSLCGPPEKFAIVSLSRGEINSGDNEEGGRRREEGGRLAPPGVSGPRKEDLGPTRNGVANKVKSARAHDRHIPRGERRAGGRMLESNSTSVTQRGMAGRRRRRERAEHLWISVVEAS